MVARLTKACDKQHRYGAWHARRRLGAMLSFGRSRTVLAALCAIFLFQEVGHTQTTADPYAKAYLNDRLPGPADMARLPKSARNVIVAKVRLTERPRYLVGRDQSGAPPPPPNDLFEAQFKIVSVLQGTRTASGTEYVVRFGEPGTDLRYIYPHTPNQISRDYIVVTYLADSSVRRLLEFPVSEIQYQEWEQEVFNHERERSRPGTTRP